MLRLTVSRSVGQSASLLGVRPHLGHKTTFFRTAAYVLMWGDLSDEMMVVSFTITTGFRQRSHFWVRVTQDSWPYILLSQIRDSPNLEGQVPGIYPPETRWPSYTPWHCAPFSSLPTTGLPWKYSKQPPHGEHTTGPLYITPARTAQKISLHLLRVLSLPERSVPRAVP
jgi:hypothetical protein